MLAGVRVFEYTRRRLKLPHNRVLYVAAEKVRELSGVIDQIAAIRKTGLPPPPPPLPKARAVDKTPTNEWPLNPTSPPSPFRKAPDGNVLMSDLMRGKKGGK
jgi:hypothetical protein